MTLNIAKEYTKTPGARYRSDGLKSGQDFRETLLAPKFKESIEKKEKLVIDFDGGYGYPTSFLEESFGGLVRETKSRDIFNCMEFISDEDESVIDKVKQYIEDAIKELDK